MVGPGPWVQDRTDLGDFLRYVEALVGVESGPASADQRPVAGDRVLEGEQPLEADLDVALDVLRRADALDVIDRTEGLFAAVVLASQADGLAALLLQVGVVPEAIKTVGDRPLAAGRPAGVGGLAALGDKLADHLLMGPLNLRR